MNLSKSIWAGVICLIGLEAVAGSLDPKVTIGTMQDMQRVIQQTMTLTHSSPTATLLEGAIRGMTWALDKHTNYFSTQEAKDFMAVMKGGFGGVGMTFGMSDDRYTVFMIIPGSPAEKGGLLPGDRIMSVNNAPISKMGQMDVVHKIRGQEGTTVTLTVVRESLVTQTLDLALVRGSIKTEVVKFHKLGTIGYVRLNDFSETCAGEIKDAIRKLQEQKVEGLVLDLRNNPGGSLQAAVEIAGTFLKPGQPVVSVEGPDPNLNQVMVAPRSEVMSSLPLVVLLNRFSASASEVVTGALQDYGRALVVGTQSYGKASVQRTWPISRDGDMIKITGQHYFTPKHRLIHDIGLTPDVVDEGETTSRLVLDLQYRECFAKAAKAFLKTGPEIKEDAIEVPDTVLAQIMDMGLRGGVLVDKADIEREKAVLKRLVRVEVARLMYGETGANKQTVKEDATVQRAVDYLRVLQAVPAARP